MSTRTPAPLNRLAALCLFAAPLVLLAGDGLQVVAPSSIGWTIALWLSFVLFVPAIFALAHLLRPVAPRLALVAGSFTLLGVMLGATMMGLFRAFLTLQHLDPTAPADRLLETLAPTTLMPGAIFPLGLLLFAAALLRTRRVPPLAAVLLGLGAVLFPVGHAVGVMAALIGGDLVLLVALGWIGYEVYVHPELWSGGSTPTVAAGDPVSLKTATSHPAA